MQIVIDIPNEKSEKLIRQMKLDRNFRECKIIELPKGHGRLIDYNWIVDNVIKQLGIKDRRYLLEAEKALMSIVDNATTIIEADK